jgi:hypothetical protein
MRRRREQRSARPSNIASRKVSQKLPQKQQDLTNKKSEIEETIDQSISIVTGHSNKKAIRIHN